MKKRKTNQRDQKRTVKKNKRTQESVTIGMDLGDKTSRYCVLNSEGEILREGQVATTKEVARRALRAAARLSWQLYDTATTRPTDRSLSPLVPKPAHV